MRSVFLVTGAWIAASIAAAAEPQSACLRLSAGLGDAFEAAALEQIEEARRRLARDPRNAQVGGRLGMILQAYEQYAAAEQCYAEAAAEAPDRVRWRYLHALVLSRLGRHELALEQSRAVLALDPAFLPARLLEARLLRLAGELEASLRAARKALALDPESPQARFAAGQALAAAGRREEAARELEAAVRLSPYFAQARYALATAYRRLGRLEEARRELEIHRRLGQIPPPEPPNPHLDEVFALYRGARAHLARGSLAAREGEAAEAVAEFEAALELNPRLPVAHANLVALYGELGRFDQAEEHYREAIRISPSWAEAHSNWGGLLLRQGRLAEAAETLGKAVEMSPHFAEARVQLGITLDELGRPAEAAEQYRQALESNPLHPHAHYLLGRSLLRQGRLQEGLDLLERAVDVGDGRTAAYLDALARVHEAEGNFEVALGYARRALERARRDGMAELAAPLEETVVRLADKAAAP